MKRALCMLLAATSFVVVRAVMQLCGLDVHASFLAGMPQSSASFVIGPIYVLVQLLASVVSPIVAVAALFETLLRIPQRL